MSFTAKIPLQSTGTLWANQESTNIKKSNYMKSTIMVTGLIIFVFSILTELKSQTHAVTAEGKEVLLKEDGTWEYNSEPKIIQQTSSVYIKGKKLISGEKTLVYTGDLGLAHPEYKLDTDGGINTSISIAKDKDKILIIFWQESTDDSFYFEKSTWNGTVIVYLENGETITLTDRNIKGLNRIPNGYKSPKHYIKDLYQRYSVHYLTKKECLKLKKSKVVNISYSTNSEGENGSILLDLNENYETIKEQLLALKL
jgi:hypothetical protein